MAKRSMFTELVTRMSDELDMFREMADEPDVPFMQERVKPSIARKRLFSMPPGDRKRMADEMGREAFLKLIRGG